MRFSIKSKIENRKSHIDNRKSSDRGYTDDLEKSYGLVFNYTKSAEDQDAAVRKGVELLQIPAEKRWNEL